MGGQPPHMFVFKVEDDANVLDTWNFVLKYIGYSDVDLKNVSDQRDVTDGIPFDGSWAKIRQSDVNLKKRVPDDEFFQNRHSYSV